MFSPSIETFLTVVSCGSLSKAASMLNVAQTTISHRLAMLEQEVGFTLIERGKGLRQARLTPAGETFSRLAEQWSSIEHAIAVLKSQGPTITMTVGSVDSFSTVALAKVLRALAAHQPAIRLDIRTLHSVEIYAGVETRQLDVGFALRNIVYPNVNVTKCCSSPMVVLRVRSGRRRRPRRASASFVHPRELNPDHELVMPWGPDFSSWHDHWWEPTKASHIKLDNLRNLMNLLRTREQWTILPMFVAKAAMAGGDYQAFRVAENPPEYVCYRITHKLPTSANAAALRLLDRYFALRESE